MRLELSLATKLLQINAIKLSPQSPFKWASGLNSPIYCDNRIALSFPKVRNHIRDGFVKLVDHIDVDVIAGVATAGIPHGAILADALDLPFIYVRSTTKQHGRQNKIEGFIQPGQRCVVIEDLISTGGSVIKAIDVLREEGISISHSLSVFTYNLPIATENFKKANCSFSSLSNYNALLEVAKELKLFPDRDLQTLQEWKKDPQKWSDSFKAGI